MLIIGMLTKEWNGMLAKSTVEEIKQGHLYGFLELTLSICL